MQTEFVIWGSSRINYTHWGTGTKLLLCLHGYGESAASFAFLADRLGAEFTILAPDLPFHGATQWKDGLYFDPASLPDLIDRMVAALHARGLPAIAGLRTGGALPIAPDHWWLLGYSMGGRVALSLLQQKPERIAGLVLLAPDGLKVNMWYWLATQTLLGNRVFRRIMQRPRFFFLILQFAGKLKWVNPGIHKFIRTHIDDPHVRDELYNRWTVMRGFRPDIRSIRSIIRKRRLPVSLLYGRHDRIIRPEKGERFRKGIESTCKLYILDAGHALLQPKYADTIAGLLKDSFTLPLSC
jgi:pimeloyl-ACP methyl ester carboxylesterase